MKFKKILSFVLLIFCILLVGGFFSKKSCEHPDIKVSVPDIITSPLIIEGEARGTWYFEADFPVLLLDENGDQIALAIAFAQDYWMTEDFVPFKVELKFNVQKRIQRGILVFKKDNPSDLPEYDDEFRIPVMVGHR